MKVSILGTRGIPARYGGFETCVQELSTRLVKRGHEVTVYCKDDGRPRNAPDYKGVALKYLPMRRNKYLDYTYYALASTIDSIRSDAEILHFFGCGRVPLTALGRVTGKGVVMTLDGLEWNRPSYPWLARAIMRSYAELAMVFPSATVVDSMTSVRWYHERTRKEPAYIPYGTPGPLQFEDAVLERYGLRAGKYVLFVGRLVEEKGVHTLIDAFKHLNSGDVKLAIVGGFPGPSEYVDRIMKEGDERVMFLGYVYGPQLNSLMNSALIYVHPTTLDGTSISLLSALGLGSCIISSDLKENQDVAKDGATYFKQGDVESLTEKLQHLIENSKEVDAIRGRSLTRAKEMPTWDDVTAQYELLYCKACGR